MYKILSFISLAFLLTACSQTYYVVRHAEKQTAENSKGSTDVPLTVAGAQRAENLKNLLRNKKITHVYSTNTIRTKTTAQPTAAFFNLQVNDYGPRPDTAFIQTILSKKGNVLVVGHSNTVDDIVNGLMGKILINKDLDDVEYDNLFVVKKRGKKMKFVRKKF